MDVESIRSEIAFRFSRSSGPGGQHAQKSSTRVEALFDVEESAGLSPAERRRVLERIGPVVRAVAQDERSQLRNRELATDRIVEQLREAVKVRRPAAPDEADRRVEGTPPRREEAARPHETAATRDRVTNLGRRGRVRGHPRSGTRQHRRRPHARLVGARGARPGGRAASSGTDEAEPRAGGPGPEAAAGARLGPARAGAGRARPPTRRAKPTRRPVGAARAADDHREHGGPARHRRGGVRASLGGRARGARVGGARERAREAARRLRRAARSEQLPAGATSVEVPLGATALRVHLLGRGRGGRLVRRAVMSPLTPRVVGRALAAPGERRSRPGDGRRCAGTSPERGPVDPSAAGMAPYMRRRRTAAPPYAAVRPARQAPAAGERGHPGRE